MLFYNIYFHRVGISEYKNVLLRRRQNNGRITALRFVYAFILVIQFYVYPRMAQILFTISSKNIVKLDRILWTGTFSRWLLAKWVDPTLILVAIKLGFIKVNKGFLVIKEVGSPENPTLFRELSLYDFKIVVWCAMSATSIIGPSFFLPQFTSVCNSHYDTIFFNTCPF